MPSSYNIGPRYENLVRELVESGRYTSASEVMRDSLRLLEQREESRKLELARLKKAYDEGMASGAGRDVSADALLAELKADASSNG
ncbi:putative addiction module antidote protein, CopG/Arc/MetJ family [Rhizobium sp. PDO1-076]|uniref:type II toxin-antitoxin system ParD family antitoxin n=1 Tax=Rhizobium sp. PDO1-076 TaxID=1125979 RepID=UPI00024E39DD|nr:type II toxin-antitoxin system ParD family antitoxin [Rhizobium sp. PDO1-076]EHS48915.1 putative addiction module antidote protein, CopG/Arc/MetJ family [Rhizobium sp. PDO1-076]